MTNKLTHESLPQNSSPLVQRLQRNKKDLKYEVAKYTNTKNKTAAIQLASSVTKQSIDVDKKYLTIEHYRQTTAKQRTF